MSFRPTVTDPSSIFWSFCCLFKRSPVNLWRYYRKHRKGNGRNNNTLKKEKEKEKKRTIRVLLTSPPFLSLFSFLNHSRDSLKKYIDVSKKETWIRQRRLMFFSPSPVPAIAFEPSREGGLFLFPSHFIFSRLGFYLQSRVQCLVYFGIFLLLFFFIFFYGCLQ